MRGSVGATARDVYVDGPSWMVEETEILVESAGGRMLKGPTGADGIIRFREDKFDRRVISVDSRTGKEREIELSYSLSFDLSDQAGKLLLDNSRVYQLRDYTIDVDAILGKATEEEVLKREMRRAAVSQLMRRVDSVLGG